MSKFAGQEVGTILGKGQDNQLEMAVAFVERDKAPKLGSFLIVEEKEFMKRKLLCRVEQMDYGDFQTTRGERQRALVEKYLRDKSGHSRELTEEEKRGLFFRHYALKVLGELRSNEKKIVTEYRQLPELSSTCRYPSADELKIIVSAGLQNFDHAIKVGNLAIGDEQDHDVKVAFEPQKFERRRTAIFARTGYGKSNLSKIVVALAALTSKAGILVMDIDGEYTFETVGSDGKKVSGLADIDLLKPKLVVYTDRLDISEKYQSIARKSFLNLEKMPIHEISRLLSNGDQTPAVIKDMATWNAEQEKAWKKLIRAVRDTPDNSSFKDRRDTRVKHINEFLSNAKIPVTQQNALRRELDPLLQLDNPSAGNFLEEIPGQLRNGNLVILDLSLMTMQQGIQFSSAVLNKIFTRNVFSITTGKAINAIAVFEEAQNVLNKKAVEDGRSVFVRWAKEGRKFNLGLIYVTQQPGAIAEEIVSQTDNYFVMHLLNQSDIDTLQRANRHYGGVISQFLCDETIVGNAYIYSAPHQPYIFPARVSEFSKSFFDSQFGEFTMKDVAQILKPVASKADGKDIKKVIGSAGYELYGYFTAKKLRLAVMDDTKKWVDYGFTESLLRYLNKSGMLKIPQFGDEQNTPKMKIADELDGEETDFETSEEEISVEDQVEG